MLKGRSPGVCGAESEPGASESLNENERNEKTKSVHKTISETPIPCEREKNNNLAEHPGEVIQITGN